MNFKITNMALIEEILRVMTLNNVDHNIIVSKVDNAVVKELANYPHIIFYDIRGNNLGTFKMITEVIGTIVHKINS